MFLISWMFNHFIVKEVFMKGNFKNIVKLGTCLSILVLFSGCKQIFDWFKKKTDKAEEIVEVVQKEIEISKPETQGTGEVLLNIDGKPVLRESEFNKHLNQMLQMNPYFRGASTDSLPMPIKRKFFDELIKQEIILAWANKNNIDQDPEFIKNFEEMKNLVKRSLLVQRFESKIFDDIKVSDSEINDYYKENKEKFIKEPGGVMLSAIKFDNKEKANNFYDEVKDRKSDFVELAKKEDAKSFQDFGRISKEKKDFELNDIPLVIRQKAFALKNLPAIEKVNVGKNTWVIYVSDKQDPTYFQISEIKTQLEAMLKNNKFRDILEQRVGEIKKDFTVDVNENFFKSDTKAEQKEEDVKETSPSAAV
ncbi:hypothetical protein GF322_01865 [Candidatus Dependentiae bacterium]|nr:hypothetical protein [Candidatus Dependentiae bacterium]